MDAFQEFVYLRTYARYLESEGRRETWQETVDRYCDYLLNPARYAVPIPEKVQRKIRQGILNMDVMPSMRLLWSAGEACDASNICAYNCSGVTVDTPLAFGEILLILMCGAGVGYSVERQYVEKLPQIKHQRNVPVSTITIRDSKGGWQEALNAGVALWWDGRDIIFDFSEIRPEGAPLKKMGGRASGPEVLRKMLDATRNIILSAAGRKLTPLECHDICCHIARCVVVGGVRRSAMISLSDIDDHDMRDCKIGVFPPERFGANNSAVYRDKPSDLDFLQDFAILGKSGTGERGFFNLGAARKNAPHRRKSKNIAITNPCFTGDMQLLTENGYMRFADIPEGRVGVVSGKTGQISDGMVWCSGERSVVRIRRTKLNDVICTPDHVFLVLDSYGEDMGEKLVFTECEAKDLLGRRIVPFLPDAYYPINKDDFMAGFIQGDGGTGRLKSKDHKGLEINIGEKDKPVAEFLGLSDYGRSVYSRVAYDVALSWGISGEPLPTRGLPQRRPNKDFLCGLFSANGCVIDKYRVSIKSTCRQMLEDLRVILSDDYAIESYITTNKSQTVKFSNGEYRCRESYDLNIGKYDSLLKFLESIGFLQPYKRAALKRLITIRSPRVRSVTPCGVEKVYDFSEPLTNWGVVNGVVAHNCAEVTLRNREFCNLSTYVIRPGDDFYKITDKATTAAWIGVLQSTFADFPYLSPEWEANCIEERLCGVSPTGVLDNLARLDPKELELTKKQIVRTVRHAAELLGINVPAAATCVKPNGTVSALVDSAAGLHPRWAKYFRRNIQISINDPLFKLMADQGAPHMITPDDPYTAIVSFPRSSPEGAVVRHDLSAIEQLNTYKNITQNYCEMNASCTIYVSPNEWIQVAHWVYENWDAVNGLSFFPRGDHAYKWAPYEDITQEEYDKMSEDFPELDFSKLSDYEHTDQTTGSKEYACTAGGCEI